MNEFKFHVGFSWGSATSAYQVEGMPLADGAGPSIWHRFSREPGAIRDGDTGDRACEHYTRYPEDIGWMKQLGLNAYRMSISWSRIFPEGKGTCNTRGLDHYERVVDALLAKGIAPNITLYHWDLPAALDDRGGWLNPDISEWFGEYAAAVIQRLGDRVTHWATLNEPWVVTDGGYLFGVLAPGHRSRAEACIAARNLMRAHGRGVQAARANRAKSVGLVLNIEPKYPASQSPEDLAATARADAYMNEQFILPALEGRVHEALPKMWGESWSEWTAADLALAHQPLDFLGVNYYTRSVVAHQDDTSLTRSRPVPQTQHMISDTGWEVYPEAFEKLLLDLSRRYPKLPLMVTENGSAFVDQPVTPGVPVLEDPPREAYLIAHLQALARAMQKGANVKGYYAWSLIDNLEWALGFSKRFGLIHVDHQTQKRTVKQSGLRYASIVKAGAIHRVEPDLHPAED